MLNLAHEVNEALKAFGWDDIEVTHYFNSVELYDGFVVCGGDPGKHHEITTFKVDHSQFESGEATPRKIASGIIDYIINEQRNAPGSLSQVNITRYMLEDTIATLKSAATDIAILIGRELEDTKRAENDGVDCYISLESFYRCDLDAVKRLIDKLSSL